MTYIEGVEALRMPKLPDAVPREAHQVSLLGMGLYWMEELTAEAI